MKGLWKECKVYRTFVHGHRLYLLLGQNSYISEYYGFWVWRQKDGDLNWVWSMTF